MTTRIYIATTAALLLLALGAGCAGPTAGEGEGVGQEGEGQAAGEGEGEGDPGTPVVIATSPIDGAVDVALNGRITVNFSEAMDEATLTTSTFTLSCCGAPAAGEVLVFNSSAEFRPDADLATNTDYIATITTGAASALGVPLAHSVSWSFHTGTTVLPSPQPVSLGAAGNFAVLAKSAISTVPQSVITGDIGVSPAAATFITGFSLIADGTNVFSTSTQVTGQVFAADFTAPTPSNMTTAVSDMELAYTDAAGRAADVIELGAGNIGGATLAPGVYKWGTGLLIPAATNVTLNGDATDVWIFQIAQDLTMANGTSVFLSGGALAKNVFWQVAGFVEVGTGSHLEGVVLTQTAITLKTGASANGRLLAQTAVTLDTSTVVAPAP